MASSHSPTQSFGRPSSGSTFDVPEAVQRGELALSLSTMLGCDYIFVTHERNHKLLDSKHLEVTIRELLDIMETTPQQSIVVSVNELENGDITFTRYDYKWEDRQVSNVIATQVTNADQADFMLMMFDCSTTC